MITAILQGAHASLIDAARQWTSDHLHIPLAMVTDTVAVAYVVQHYEMGDLSGWDGFIEDIGERA